MVKLSEAVSEAVVPSEDSEAAADVVELPSRVEESIVGNSDKLKGAPDDVDSEVE